MLLRAWEMFEGGEDESETVSEKGSVEERTTRKQKQCAYFHCHYFVGPGLVTVTPRAWSHRGGYSDAATATATNVATDTNNNTATGNTRVIFEKDKQRRDDDATSMGLEWLRMWRFEPGMHWLGMLSGRIMRYLLHHLP